MTDFQKGQMVNVINSVHGKFFIEGRAKIVGQVCSPGDGYYLVDFGDEYGPTSRYVDPLAQGSDVGGYIEKLNDR